MEKAPIDTNLIPNKRPRQSEAFALIKARPRSKAELTELMSVKKSNLNKVLQTLISKGKIIPNPATGKYEIYSKKHG